MTDRSTSHSREPVTSTGRGGIGNMRPASTSRDRQPDDLSTRGREPAVAISEIRSTGRGGAGNFRSPSRDPADNRDVRAPGEREAIRAHEEHERDAVHSTGRGGAGNMSRERGRGGAQLPSPSPSRAGHEHQQVHSSGRGGAGNIVPGPAPAYERGRTGAVDGVHSTGRGGLANLTASPAPPPEHVVHHLHPGEYESSGRGGAGNISRSRERGDENRSASKERGGIAGLWDRMHGHPHGHAPETIPEGEGARAQPAAAEGAHAKPAAVESGPAPLGEAVVGGGGHGAL
ncbi:hypothetical protein B0H12DRAFT_1049849 [Mycena haematopus]|nr:hypothetical protein B0H12DRAFT_1049849 [Mycena haematopus]